MGRAPKGFFDTSIGAFDMDDYVALGSHPADRLRAPRHYSRELDGHYGRQPWTLIGSMLRLDMKAAAVKQLQDGERDVGQSSDRKAALWTLTCMIWAFTPFVGIDFTMDKRQRIMTCESAATHAMTLAGVDAGSGRQACAVGRSRTAGAMRTARRGIL